MDRKLSLRTLAYLVGHYKNHNETIINQEEIEAINFILDENEQLQQENKQLKELYENFKIINEEHRTLNGMLRETINKAIEWVNKNKYYFPEPKKLLEILKGDSNE